jgi:hypothetical protein
MAVFTAGQVRDCLNAAVIVGEDKMQMQVEEACGADLMSDVLAFIKEKAILLTGLVSPHVIRTAEMLDIAMVVFVRGKIPPKEIREMAAARDMVIMSTKSTMFEACGVLYQMGLKGGHPIDGQ